MVCGKSPGLCGLTELELTSCSSYLTSLIHSPLYCKMQTLPPFLQRHCDDYRRYSVQSAEHSACLAVGVQQTYVISHYRLNTGLNCNFFIFLQKIVESLHLLSTWVFALLPTGSILGLQQKIFLGNFLVIHVEQPKNILPAKRENILTLPCSFSWSLYLFPSRPIGDSFHFLFPSPLFLFFFFN